MRRVDQIILRPLMTEKSAMATEADNTYAFEVGKDANLLVLTGDPLSPQSTIASVWFRGRAVDRKNP